jgi:uncharacterized protein
VSLSVWAGLAAVTFAAALLQAAGGFGFAVVATPLYLMVLAPLPAVQLVILTAAALSLSVLPALRRALAPGLLARLCTGSLAGLPLGLAALRYSDPTLVRIVAGTLVLGFAGVLALLRRRGAEDLPAPVIARGHSRDVAAGLVAGAATALVGMAGPPVLVYLLLAGAASQLIRATLLAFFALVYSLTVAAHAATIGVPGKTWAMTAILLPGAFAGGAVGRRLGDRLGARGFALLSIMLLAAAGLLTLAAAAGLFGRNE